MNELFPIIRRKRRPLVEPDTVPVVVRTVEPLKAELANVATPPAEVEPQPETHDTDVAT